MPAPRATYPRLVLVEDDTFLAGMYVTKLTLEHFDVTLATDGKAGLKAITETKPDLVLLDLLLPKVSGFEVLEAIKKDPTTKDIPVILLTNLSQRSDIERGLALGAEDFLIKAHFLPSEVIDKIEQVLVKHGHALNR